MRKVRLRGLGATISAVAVAASVIGAMEASASGKQVRSKASGGQLVVAAFGGAYGKAEQDAYFTPFTKATGIKVRVLPAEPTLAQVKLQVQNHNVLWDVAALQGVDANTGCNEGLLARVNYKLVKKADLAVGGGYKCGLLASLFTEGIGYKKSAFKTPPTWSDFFNVTKYPGKRTMESYIEDGTLEDAALGAGVPVNRLYPLDINKAINEMKSLGSNLVLVSSLAQASQLLQSGSAVMIQSAIGRILPLMSQGYAISLVGERAPSIFTIPKGAPHTALAQKFFSFIASCQKCTATMERETAYGGPNKNGIKLVPPRIRKLLPYDPQVDRNSYFQNLAWWSKNAARAQQAFQTFQAG